MKKLFDFLGGNCLNIIWNSDYLSLPSMQILKEKINRKGTELKKEENSGHD